MVCGVDLVERTPQTKDFANAIAQIPPTLDVSELSSSGRIKLKFSDPMGLESLLNTTESNRRLKSKSSAASSSEESTGESRSANAPENSIDFDRYKYLLSSKHLNITI
jgi:hypothetical protein